VSLLYALCPLPFSVFYLWLKSLRPLRLRGEHPAVPVSYLGHSQIFSGIAIEVSLIAGEKHQKLQYELKDKKLMIKVDMHIHTSYSPDSLLPIDDLLRTCDGKGIDCVAVVDHDTAEGGLKLYELAPSKIIVGEEIHTTLGEIIGLFLKENIQPWLSPMETVERIKAQGGLVYLPHPFDGMRAAVLERQALDEIWEKIDIVEVFNSRNVFPWSNWKASSFAVEKGIVSGAGSDAHTRFEVGRAYVMMESFDSAADFLSKLARAEIRGRKTPVVFNLLNKVYKIVRGIG